MAKYIKVQMKDCRPYPCWYIVISTMSELFEHEKKVVAPQHVSAMNELIEKYVVDRKISHVNGQLASNYAALIFVASLGDPNNENMVDGMQAIEKCRAGISEWKIKSIAQGKKLYLGRFGSGFPADDDYIKEKYDILDSREDDMTFFPDDCKEKLLKITKWPNGTHWYAKLGEIDVVEGDYVKWDKKEHAISASKKFAEHYSWTIKNITDFGG